MSDNEHHAEFTRLIEPIARELLGEPNRALSNQNELRYGQHGSLSIDLKNGTFFDHEAGVGGGTIAFVQLKGGFLDQADALDWMRARGYLNGKAGNGHARPRKIVATYDYQDETGNLLFQVVRFEPKTFRQRKPDGNGEWSWSVKDVRNIPYRLPELIEDIALEHIIFVVEGEKDVDNLRALGIPATCNAGGAGKWREELNHYLDGADVVIVPDNDSAGRKHAAAVADALLDKVATRVRVLNLARFSSGISEKGDISDWLKDGGSTAVLWTLVEGIPDWSRGDTVETSDSQFPLRPFKTIVLSLEPNYRIKGIFPRIGLAVVWGPPKCGKSFWTFDAVMHIALGRPYRGHRVQQATVVYCALEGGFGFNNRVVAWRNQYLADDIDVPFYLVDVPLNLVADRDRLVAAIRNQLAQSPGVIVIDTLNRALVGDENNSEDMAKFIRAADYLRATFGCLIILIHHCGVAGTRPRGHTSLPGADDAQIAVARAEDGTITIKVEHMKDAEGVASLGARLDRISLGSDTDGDEITSCVVSPTGAGTAQAHKSKLTAPQKRFLQILKDAAADVPDEHKTVVNEQIAISREYLKMCCLAKGWLEETKSNRARAKVSEMINTLAGKGLVDASSLYVWIL